MLRERSSDIVSVMGHPLYIKLKMCIVLILAVLFWFATIYPKCMYKIHLFIYSSTIYPNCKCKIHFGNSMCSAKEAVIFFLSWSTLYPVALWKCIVSLFYFFLFWFASIHPKCQSECVKIIFSWTFRFSQKK